METSNLPDAEFKTLVLRMLNELRGKRDDLSENFNIEIGANKKETHLAGVAQWLSTGLRANQRVAGSISHQGTCLGCGPGPQ